MSLPPNPPDPLPQSERDRLNRQQSRILDRLRQGRATNAELGRIAQRFGARLKELRDKGYDIQIITRDRERGLTVYALFVRGVEA